MMNAADSAAPIATAQIVARCSFLRQHVPAEQPQPEERRLEEERGQTLHRQRSAEHVADEARVLRPVHPELELLHQPGHHADRDVDHQQRAEEARQLAHVLVAGAVPLRVQDRDEERQPDRDRHEQEVVDRRGRELQPRQIQLANVHSSSCLPPRSAHARRRRRQPSPCCSDADHGRKDSADAWSQKPWKRAGAVPSMNALGSTKS